MAPLTNGHERGMCDGDDAVIDVVVVGAGLAGISFARFYLETRKQCNLIILERDKVVGGVWSSSRVFDAFWVQSPLRQSHFSDRPLHLPADAPTYYDTFGAKYISQYLEDYVDSHAYAGRSLRSHIWFDAEVQGVEKKGGCWTLQVGSGSGSGTPAAPRRLRCMKLVLANGITSLPAMPASFLGATCPVEAIHHRDFGAAAARILSRDSKYKHVTVIGGGKSAADMVYATVKAGKIVSWLVRKSGGEGPGMFLDPSAEYPYRNVVEQGNTLHAIALNPSAFKDPSWFACHYHQEEDGLSLLKEKLLTVDRKCKANANYRARPGALPCFRDLEPDASFFWQTGPIGVAQQKDFWETISQQVNVFRADISKLDESLICLEDGREIRTDIALCGTGWSSQCPFLTPQQTRDLGLAHEPVDDDDDDDDDDTRMWGCLMQEADQAILHKYPILRQSGTVNQRSLRAPVTPARLYRGIAPLSDDSVIFLGRPRMANGFRGSEAQAIWATAYLDGHVRQGPLDQVRQDIAYHSMFSRRRYPTRGGDGLNLHADLIWYTDALVCEAGLSSHRKDWFHDWHAPVLSSDFRDCRDEYVRKYGLK